MPSIIYLYEQPKNLKKHDNFIEMLKTSVSPYEKVEYKDFKRYTSKQIYKTANIYKIQKKRQTKKTGKQLHQYQQSMWQQRQHHSKIL